MHFRLRQKLVIGCKSLVTGFEFYFFMELEYGYSAHCHLCASVPQGEHKHWESILIFTGDCQPSLLRKRRGSSPTMTRYQKKQR